MKKSILSISSIALLSLAACNQPEAPKAPAVPHNWELTITPHTSMHALDSVSQAWKKDSIGFTISKLEYNDAWKLIKVKGALTCLKKGTHVSGTFGSDSLVSYTIKMDDSPSVEIKGK